MLTLYDGIISGHSHKVRLFLSLLGLEHRLETISLADLANRSAAFLANNPFGQIPVLDDEGVLIRDSNAILVYLASRYGGKQWWPDDPLALARIQEWLAVSTLKLYNGPVKARAVKLFARPWDLEAAQQESHALLAIMNRHLEARDWLSIDEVSIADIACYTYTAHAPEGGVSLDDYRNVRSWLARIEALRGFVAMPRSND
jgi:glutathione S-transferase